MNNSGIQQSYTKNYMRIYSTQILSMLLGFVSLFVVVPYLSADKITYGIYSVCISITIFLSYADLGFLSAGMKYAAECFSKGEKEKEISLVGFTHFILLVFVLILCGIFLFLSFNPDLLIRNIEQGVQRDIAHKLLLILAISSPLVVFQRMLQMIFSIRLQEYNIQIINIFGSFLKIMSVFYFFSGMRYDIVGYYLFLQIVTALVVIIGILLTKYKYNYDYKLLFINFKFSKEIFIKTKGLAFSSLFATITWILYYELDSIAIGKLIGAEAVALYAIGLTMLSFFRSILGVIFAPFSARFNHFIGLKQENELKSFYNHVVTITLPIVVFPIIAIVIMAKGLTISWVGTEYSKSVEIVRILLLCNVLGFISYPAGMMLLAQEKIKQMYIINALLPIIFWVGIMFSVKYLGIDAFAIFKAAAFLIVGLVYLWLSLKFISISIWKFFQNNVLPYLPGLIIMGVILWFLRDWYVKDKNKLYLLYNLIFTGIGCLAAFLLSFLTAKQFQQYLFSILSVFKFNKKK
jgi:O-antigen/teichoic acid export membrane protein